jgi:hypothetical protein
MRHNPEVCSPNNSKQSKWGTRRTFLSLTFASSASGCIPVPTFTTDPELKYYAPDVQEKAAKTFSVAPDRCAVYVFQEPTIASTKVNQIVVDMDGKNARMLATRAFTLFVSTPGAHALNAISAGMFPTGAIGSPARVRLGKQIPLNLEAGKTYYFSTMIRSEMTIVGAVGFYVLHFSQIHEPAARSMLVSQIHEPAARSMLETYRLSASVPTS